MKNLTIIPLILILFTCLACETEQKGPSHLEVGRARLIDSGRAIEAIELLTKAEKKEKDKAEPRALLVIAYSYALESGAAQGQGYEQEYKKQRTERIAALNEAEINKMIENLSKRSEVQQNGFQALAEKGTDAAVVIVDQLCSGAYPEVHDLFISTLVKIGSEAVDPILEKVNDVATPAEAKMKLIRVLGEIKDKNTVEKLRSIDITSMTPALKLEVYTTFYRLGETTYKSEILTGLTANEIEMRRAAAKAMKNLKGVNTKSLINALKDTDSQVVTDIAEALSVHKTKDAVEPLVDILKSEHDTDAKEAVLKTLIAYAEAGGDLKKGIGRRVSVLLIDKEVSNSQDRLRLVHFLMHPVLVKQLKAARLLDDLDTKLYEYAEKEESKLVKTALHDLLELIRK
jgi:HEAT repeat protein